MQHSMTGVNETEKGLIEVLD